MAGMIVLLRVMRMSILFYWFSTISGVCSIRGRVLRKYIILLMCDTRAPFHKGLRLIASFLNTRFAIELRLKSIVRLIATLCEMGPR